MTILAYGFYPTIAYRAAQNVTGHSTRYTERQTTMALYLVSNGCYDDTRYYAVPAEDMTDALKRFIQYAKEHDIDIDRPAAIKYISVCNITVLV